MFDKNVLGETKYLIAIDGGGTKTEFVLFTDEGNVLKQTTLCDSNPNNVGPEVCCNVLVHGIELLGIKQYNVSSIFAGIAGFISSDAKGIIEKEFSERYPGSKVFFNGDVVNILGFAPDPMNAVGIICGTGTSVFMRKNGVLQSIGGWGYLFDEGGSGFAIGRDAVRETLDVCEGIKTESILSRQITAEIGDIKTNLTEFYKKGVRSVAALAPIVFNAAESGDTTSLAILNRNAECITKYIIAAQNNGPYKGKIYGGGGLLKNEIYRNMLQKKINTEIIISELPPIYGAAVECCLQNNIKPSVNFYKNFELSYKKGEE